MISENARREKSTSTITGLHLWWARRPLAACRAVVCASLWFDPADALCPPKFRIAAAIILEEFIANATRGNLGLAETCGPSWRRWLGFDAAQLHNNSAVLREALLLFLGQFSSTRASLHSTFVQCARRLTRAAHPDGTSGWPIVFDPFAGGGSIPLEALRAGASVIAGDVNPVALLINDVLIARAPRLGQALREHVLQSARKMSEKLNAQLAALFPGPEGRIPLAYLWARTILSEAPGSNTIPTEIPLMRSLWLSKRPGNRTALRWVRDANNEIVCDKVDALLSDGTCFPVLRPRLEIFHPASAADVEAGTSAGGGATCPVTGFTTPKARVRAQLIPRKGGTRDARLLVVVTRPQAGSGREFHLPSDADFAALRAANDQFGQIRNPVIELLPVGRVWKNNPFRVHNYGMTSWGHLFTQRQHVVLTLLANEVAELGTELEAVQAVLALTVARLADYLNSGCCWNPTGEKLQHLFCRQAVPMVWDFCEANPVGGSVGDWLKMVEGACNALEFVPAAEANSEVLYASAADCPLPNDSVEAVITDPPYYDAVPYADLSEFFYVWLRRCAPWGRAQWFASQTVDRGPEIVFDENRQKDNEFYVDSMTSALREARRVTKPNGIGVVVFAHKSTAGWEALLQAVLDAGWVVTASWPIDTELSTRVRAMNSAVLASSVHLVCRPRENSDGSLRTDEVGNWRSVLAELPVRIHEWMPRLAEEGVVGADAIFACLGPALEIFSRYSRVEKASGEVVGLREYLELVWAAVAREALATVLGEADAGELEPDARLTVIWLWTVGGGKGEGGSDSAVDDEEAGSEDEGEETTSSPKSLGGWVLEFDAARKIAQGLGARLEELTQVVEVKGSTARLLPAADRAAHLFGKSEGVPTARKAPKKRQLSLFAEIQEAEQVQGWGEVSAPKAGTTTLDRVHQAMLLFASGRGDAMKRFLVEEGVGRQAPFWKLAQSLSALYPTGSDEKRWVDGVLARKKGLGF
ncbi:MAG: hypothetical protein AUK47_24650 [Deltaproteobacteria bacterium CG2_30_63_29]|nr:MAG: hypothetical protein AUK47_24650 [Deltaproteobacteria bacterium CG2_30_63_29]PJB39909.1 MAG: adenine-specific DNA methylase [Deltaproteobacteria bacterium CG_4_9_14_3_um_filter_63_12]